MNKTARSARDEEIVIVDDSPAFLRALEAHLRHFGHAHVRSFQNPRQALDALGSGELAVGLVIVDLLMPEMSGIEVVKALKRLPNMMDVPVIVVSTHDEEEAVEETFFAGAMDYIGKPLRKLELKARVRNALRLRAALEARKAHERQLAELNVSLARANAELHRLSVTDPLTGLHNRRYFDDAVEKTLSLAARHGTEATLLIVDVDYFKAFNDTRGHLEGDQCLRSLAEALRDSVGRAHDIIARFGGEEFAVLLPSTGESGARAVSGRIHDNVQRLDIPHPTSEISDRLTVSIGSSTVTGELPVDEKELVDTADRALYVAKESGRNRTVFSRPKRPV